MGCSGNGLPHYGDVVGRLLHHMLRHWCIGSVGCVAICRASVGADNSVCRIQRAVHILLRPHLVALIHRGGHERLSNAQAIIGRIGEVSETVKAGGYGRVKLDGDDWKAQTDSTDDLPVGAKVRIIGMDSIIVKVEPENSQYKS